MASPAQPVRIAAAVPALVVRADDLLGDLEDVRAAVREHPRAEHGVGLDHRELLGRERARLEQDGVGDGDLAEVVQRRGAAQHADGAVLQPERPPEPGRQGADALRVLRRVVVAVLRGLREPVQRIEADRLRVAERGERLAGHDRLELGEPRAHGAVLEQQPQMGQPAVAEPPLAPELRERDDGRARVEAERIEHRPDRLGGPEHEHHVGRRERRLGGDLLEAGREMDRRAAGRAQLGPERVGRLPLPAGHEHARTREREVIHTGG